jgi:ribosomal protein L37E
MKQYYLIIKGEQSGPFPESEVQSMLAAGNVKPTDLCWTNEMMDWKPIHEIIQRPENMPLPPPMPHGNPSIPQSGEEQIIFCTKCGEKNPENYYKCSRCGMPLHATQVASNGMMGRIIPVKNIFALIGYYSGVFALIPIFGVLFGIAAFILGVLGLKHIKHHPDAKGVVHAWTAIILGGLSIIAHTLLIIIAIYA